MNIGAKEKQCFRLRLRGLCKGGAIREPIGSSHGLHALVSGVNIVNSILGVVSRLKISISGDTRAVIRMGK